MIPAKPMAMVAMLALAGVVVAQEKDEEQRTLPSALELLEEFSRYYQLQDPTYSLIMAVRLRDSAFRRQQGAGIPRVSGIAWERFTEQGQAREKRLILAEWELRRAWHDLLSALVLDYTRIRQEGGSAPIPMMQLLLLGSATWANPDAPFLRVISKEEGSTLADALLAVSKTPEDSLLGHIYKLHEGDSVSRNRHALILAQMKSAATVVVPRLIEELMDQDMRVVQETITALGMIGPAAKDAIPALEKLTEHDDRQIAERAKAALRQIRGR